jgi:hypothetical protein
MRLGDIGQLFLLGFAEATPVRFEDRREKRRLGSRPMLLNQVFTSALVSSLSSYRQIVTRFPVLLSVFKWLLWLGKRSWLNSNSELEPAYMCLSQQHIPRVLYQWRFSLKNWYWTKFFLPTYRKNIGFSLKKASFPSMRFVWPPNGGRLYQTVQNLLCKTIIYPHPQSPIKSEQQEIF